MTKPLRFLFGTALGVGVLAGGALAHPPHRPPPEAFEACAQKKQGDSCSVSLGSHTIDGVCQKPPDGTEQLVCVPDRPPGPPPEAVDACDQKSEGETCTVEFAGESIEGHCRSGPHEDDPLACVPDNPPPPPR